VSARWRMADRRRAGLAAIGPTAVVSASDPGQAALTGFGFSGRVEFVFGALPRRDRRSVSARRRVGDGDRRQVVPVLPEMAVARGLRSDRETE